MNTIVMRLTLSLLLILTAAVTFGETSQSQLIDRVLKSKNFTENKIGIDPERKMIVYLPPGYEQSRERYPVIYFLPNPFDGSFNSHFKKGDAADPFDRAISTRV